MKKGDLITMIDFSDINIPGALTAMKFYRRLEESIGGKTGLVVEVNGNNIVALFGGTKKIINKQMVRVINEN